MHDIRPKPGPPTNPTRKMTKLDNSRPMPDNAGENDETRHIHRGLIVLEPTLYLSERTSWLVTSTSDLVRQGESLPGLPLFHSDCPPFDAVRNMWVVWGATSMIWSRKTSWTYATGLHVFSMNQRRAAPTVIWQHVTASDIVRFCSELSGTQTTQEHRRSRKPATIRVWLQGVSSFYVFAAEQGFVSARPFQLSNKKGAQRS